MCVLDCKITQNNSISKKGASMFVIQSLYSSQLFALSEKLLFKLSYCEKLFEYREKNSLSL